MNPKQITKKGIGMGQQLYYDNYKGCFTIDKEDDEKRRYVSYQSDNGTGILNECHNCPKEDGNNGILKFEYSSKDQADWFKLMVMREEFFKSNGIMDYVENQDKYYTISMTITESHYKKILDMINVSRVCSCGDPNCGNTRHPKMLKRRS